MQNFCRIKIFRTDVLAEYYLLVLLLLLFLDFWILFLLFLVATF